MLPASPADRSDDILPGIRFHGVSSSPNTSRSAQLTMFSSPSSGIFCFSYVLYWPALGLTSLFGRMTVDEICGRANTPSQFAERTPYVPFSRRFALPSRYAMPPQESLSLEDAGIFAVPSVTAVRLTPAMTHVLSTAFETEMKYGITCVVVVSFPETSGMLNTVLVQAPTSVAVFFPPAETFHL